MPPGSPKLLLCVCATYGLATLALLMTGCRPVFQPLEKLCFGTLAPEPGRDAVPSFLALGVPVVDNLLCLLTPFFKDATGSTEGLFVTGTLFSLGLAAFLLMAIESERAGARWAVRCYTFSAAASNLIGMSVAFPLFWMTSRWGSRSSSAGGISARTVHAIGAVMWPSALAFLLLTLDPRLFPEHVQHLAVVLLNLAPVLAGPALWLVLKMLPREEPGSNAMSQQGRTAGVQAMQQLCYVYAGVCASMHATAVLQFCAAGAPMKALLAAIVRADPMSCGPFFVFVDFVGILLTALLLVGVEGGVAAVLRLLALSTVVGPGAGLLLWVAAREETLAAADGSKRKDT